MRSVKPGRGPSAMGAVGAVIACVFGLFWTVMAVSMGAPGIFPVFGVLFILMGAAQAVYNFKNATGENRFSAFDITEDGEEPDPLDRRFAAPRSEDPPDSPSGSGYRFCPYCGAELEEEFAFCGVCGKRLPGR